MEIGKRTACRSVTPDVCRGVAIFLVIWGHVLQQGLNDAADVSENVIFKIIYSFHMPLFIILSGFFFYGSQKRKGLKELVFDKAWMLLRIILIWNTVCYFCKAVLDLVQGNKVSVSVKGWFTELLMGYWFLWAVLFFTILVGIVCKLFPRRLWLLGCVLFATILLISPCRWVMLSIYPFFLVGFFYNMQQDRGKNPLMRLRYIAIVLFVTGLVFYLLHPAVGNSEIKGLLDAFVGVLRKETEWSALAIQGGRVLLYYFLGLTGSITILVSVDFLVKRIPKAKLLKSMAEIGRYSLQIYILQRVIVELICGKAYGIVVENTGQKLPGESIPMFTYIYSLLISVVFVILIYGIAKYGIRKKLKTVLFGR